jgi:predicted amino acid dehydrogenase
MVGGYVAIIESRHVSTELTVALILSTTVTTQRSHTINPITLQVHSSAPVPQLVPCQL